MLRLLLSTRFDFIKKICYNIKKAFFSKSEKKCVELPQNGATAQYSSAEGYSSERCVPKGGISAGSAVERYADRGIGMLI